MPAIVITKPGASEVRVFAFGEIAETYRVTEAGQGAGKLVIPGA